MVQPCGEQYGGSSKNEKRSPLPPSYSLLSSYLKKPKALGSLQGCLLPGKRSWTEDVGYMHNEHTCLDSWILHSPCLRYLGLCPQTHRRKGAFISRPHMPGQSANLVPGPEPQRFPCGERLNGIDTVQQMQDRMQ